MQTRPPIVTIMGHVDHGKTSLLDYIRKTKVTDKEHGGITQHIGAYQIEDPKITFIDTPGHAAFSKMRARGGQTADIVVLVIAANEGFKPQTEESLQHINDAQVPFLVAINKIDLPEANVDMVKQLLSDHGHPTEDNGGQIIAVPVSATTGEGVDKLLESISLLAEMQELKADPKADLEAVIIESKLDKGKGPVANLVIRNGSLKVGEKMHAETIGGKIKALFDDHGNSIKEALPSQPVQVLGFSEVPPVGAQVHTGSPTDLPVVAEHNLPATFPQNLPKKKTLTVIIKADVAGSNEAIKHSLPDGITLINDGVGNMSDADIFLAKTTGAQVVGFNVQIPKSVAKLADAEKVTAVKFNVIYELLEYLSDQYKRLVDPLYGLEVEGKAEILAEFKIKKDRIAGAKMISGELTKEQNLQILRGEHVVGKAKAKSLRQEKQEVNKISQGTEFGALFSPYIDFKIGDIIIAYK